MSQLAASKSPDNAIVKAYEFDALGNRTVSSLFTALLVSFALSFRQDCVEGPQNLQIASMLGRYFQKRMDLISNRDFLAVIVLQIVVLMVIFTVNPSDTDGLIFICYLFSMAFIVGVMKFAFNIVRKTLACGRWFLMPPDALFQLQEHFPHSIVPSAVYRPPSPL